MKDVKPAIWYMFDELYTPENYEWGNISNKDDIKEILNKYFNDYFDENDDKDTWFNKVKELTDSLDGYTSNMKEYKENPDNYKGNVADVSTVIRVSITSKSTTPDLYELLRLLGKERIEKRISML